MGFAWLETHRAVQIYPNAAEAQQDADAVHELQQHGWALMQLARDPDLLPQNKADTREKVLRWAHPGREEGEGPDQRPSETELRRDSDVHDVPF